VLHDIWWHVYPLGFLGAERTLAEHGPGVTHRLPGLTAWLDYAVELGVNGLALGPVFASETHGYDTTDHLRIDPRLGDEDDFAALVAACRARGVRLLLDGVFNHVGRGAAAAAWSRGAVFEGHDSLVVLDHASPAVVDHVRTVMTHWLERGADGWRLDAAYAVPPDFWQQVLPDVRAAHPEAYVVGEVLHGDYAAVVRRSGMDAVTQYELWKAVWSSLNDRNFFELAHALGRHDALLDTFAPLTFVGNHDVTRIASRLDDRRHLAHALVVLFTVGGTPSVYAGDEQGFLGVKQERAGGDDAVRPAFPASPSDLPADGWPVYRLHQELIALRRRHPWLHLARTRQLALANTHLAYEVHAGDDALVVVLSSADAPVRVDLPWAGRTVAGAALVTPRGVELAAHGWVVVGPAQ
jgi:cyclomaltodextrinase